MAVSVSLKGVVKTFGATRAVDGVSLEIEPGELFFLLGPSGCGKTTLLRCIAGFCLPEQGTVHLGDHDVTRVPPHLRDTGMVFQSYALWPHMTVQENVAFGLELRRLPREEVRRRVAETLALVRMTDRAGHRPNQLSGGQQQRVALARALVIHPRCLLLDEPLSNLDAKLRLEMRTEIRRICKEAGLTAIYVTHDQKEALSIADRLAVLDQGRVEQCGRPRDVYHRPANRFVANFVGETNFVEARVLGRDGGRLRLCAPFGEFVAKDGPGEMPAEGATVTVSLRPEVLRIGTAPDGAPNAFEGVVHDTLYLGEMAQHLVNVPGAGDGAEETVLRVFEIHPRIVARDNRAERARLWFDPEDVVVLTQ